MSRCLSFFVVFAFAFVAAGAWGSMVVPQNLAQLEAKAETIFAGVCVHRTPAVVQGRLPATEYTFQVTEAIKGRIKKGGRVTFRQFGSDAPNARGAALRVADLPRYTVGQEVLLFLNRPSSVGLTAPVGLAQGVLRVVRRPDREHEIVVGQARRKTVLAGMDTAKYTAAGEFTVAEQRLLEALPERVSVRTFCNLLRKMGEARERAAKQSRSRADRREKAPSQPAKESLR